MRMVRGMAGYDVPRDWVYEGKFTHEETTWHVFLLRTWHLKDAYKASVRIPEGTVGIADGLCADAEVEIRRPWWRFW